MVSIYGPDDVFRNYIDIRYPYRCDFYIKSKDLFIELNLHWTHGPHPFDENDLNDIELLNMWKSKQEIQTLENGKKRQNMYFSAEYTWTVSDPLKIKTAHKNKLNYILLYNGGQINDFFRRIQEKII